MVVTVIQVSKQAQNKGWLKRNNLIRFDGSFFQFIAMGKSRRKGFYRSPELIFNF